MDLPAVCYGYLPSTIDTKWKIVVLRHQRAHILNWVEFYLILLISLYKALCSNDKLIIITAGTEVMDLPAVYKGFKIKIMDVHDKSTEKSESEALSASLSQRYTDSYHLIVNRSNPTANKLFVRPSYIALNCPSVHCLFSFA
jgi:hypothetical protein